MLFVANKRTYQSLKTSPSLASGGHTCPLMPPFPYLWLSRQGRACLLLSTPAFMQWTPSKANGSLRQTPNSSSARRQAAGRVLVWHPRWKYESANNSNLMQSKCASLCDYSRETRRTSYRTPWHSRWQLGCPRAHMTTEWKTLLVQVTGT